MISRVRNILLCQYHDPQSGSRGLENEVGGGRLGIICIEPSVEQSEIGFGAASYSQSLSADLIHTGDEQEAAFTFLISSLETISV
jgi:hypothetical protein